MNWLPRIKRVDKLIGRHIAASVGVVWLVLVGFDAVTQFAQELGDVGTNGYSFAEAVAFICLTLPRRVWEMFGYAALIGSLLGLGGLAASSELTALRASGMSRLRIMLGAGGTIAALALAVVLLGETLAPAAEQRAQAVKLALRSNQLGVSTRSGLWAHDGGDIINARAARRIQQQGQPAVQLVDLRIYGLRDGALEQLTVAASADSMADGWQLKDVRITRFDAGGAHSSKRSTMPWASSLDPRLLALSMIEPDYMSMRDLARNIRYFRANGQNPSAYVNAWWAHLFYPLNTLLLVLATLPMAFGNLRSGGAGKRVFLGILLAIGWHFVQTALVSLGNVYGLPAGLANLLPAMLLAAAAVIHHRRSA